MLRHHGNISLLVVLAASLFLTPVVEAQVIGDYGFVGADVIYFSLDGADATNVYEDASGPNLTGNSVASGTTLSGWVTWNGVVCSGCSANISCYASWDADPNNGNVTIFSIDTTEDISADFSWTPTSPGTYYISCDINYYNNPYAGEPLASALTQNIVMTVT